MPQKRGHKKFYVLEKMLRTRNCRFKFIKHLLAEKRKENMYTKQPQFKSRLNKLKTIFHFICQTWGELYVLIMSRTRFRVNLHSIVT